MARIPDKVIGFMLYSEGERVGIADVELPSIEYMSESLSGAGIAGEMETPALGQLSSMTATFNFRSLFRGVSTFIKPEGSMLDCRGAMQEYNSSTGGIETTGVKITMKVLPKSVGLGKFETGATSDTSAECEVVYLKMIIDNQEVLEIDKMNYIFKVDGVDHLEEVRNILGM